MIPAMTNPGASRIWRWCILHWCGATFQGGVKVKKLCYGLIALALLQMLAVSAWASKADCGDQPNIPPKPTTEAREESVSHKSDYDEVMEEEIGSGVVYLSLINGDQPMPNACGLNPSNPSAAWTGWGGPIDADNMTIGEGPGTRNDIIIGGVLFERGIGTHAIATLVYPLTGGDYARFEGYIGMADEKDPDECNEFAGNCDFTFEVDGKEMSASGAVGGMDAGENVDPIKVEFDIPANAKELTITIGDAGNGNSCDHGCVGDAKLLTSSARPVEPGGKAAALWGWIKASY
jgi:hypothetical protein